MKSKWFEDCVARVGMRPTMSRSNCSWVPAQEYLGRSKLQTAFAAGQGPDIFIISPADFLSFLQWWRSGRPHCLRGSPQKGLFSKRDGDPDAVANLYSQTATGATFITAVIRPASRSSSPARSGRVDRLLCCRVPGGSSPSVCLRTRPLAQPAVRSRVRVILLEVFSDFLVIV